MYTISRLFHLIIMLSISSVFVFFSATRASSQKSTLHPISGGLWRAGAELWRVSGEFVKG